MNKYVKYHIMKKALFTFVLLIPLFSIAQYPSIKLSFITEDTVKICKAVVMKSETEPAAEVGVTFFVKRFFGMLPIGSAVTTNEQGEAKVNFPVTIPADEKGNVVIVASLEDDSEVAAEATTAWGAKLKSEDLTKQNALWAPRSNVAITLMVVSNLIIVAIWGVMAYIVYLVFFRIPKTGMNTHT